MAQSFGEEEPKRGEAMSTGFEMANGLVPGVELTQTRFAMRLSHVNVAEMQELVCGGVVHPHGLFARERKVAQVASP